MRLWCMTEVGGPVDMEWRGGQLYVRDAVTGTTVGGHGPCAARGAGEPSGVSEIAGALGGTYCLALRGPVALRVGGYRAGWLRLASVSARTVCGWLCAAPAGADAVRVWVADFASGCGAAGRPDFSAGALLFTERLREAVARLAGYEFWPVAVALAELDGGGGPVLGAWVSDGVGAYFFGVDGRVRLTVGGGLTVFDSQLFDEDEWREMFEYVAWLVGATV